MKEQLSAYQERLYDLDLSSSLYINVALPDDGHNYRSKHVIVTSMNTVILSHLWCCIDQKQTNKQTLIEQKEKDDVSETYDSMVSVVVKNEH